MNRPRLSLCLIVRNEAYHLAACLDSARPWVQEIVVVDTGSTDGTPELARQLGARVQQIAWPDDFAAARNVALAAAQGEWVLSLDADERLVAGTGEKLADLMAAGDAALASTGQLRAYALAICSAHDPGTPPQPPGFGTRLFPNHPQVRWVRPIHEQPAWVGDGAGKLAVVRTTAVVIEHLGYVAAERQRKRTTSRNLALLDRAIAADPTDPASFFFRGEERYIASDYAGAAADLAHAIALCRGRQGPPELARAHVLEAASRLALGDLAGARRTAEAGAARYGDAQGWWMVGQVHEARGDRRGALDAYSRAITAGETTATTLGPVAASYRAATLAPVLVSWADLALAAGDVATATERFTYARRNDPHNVAARCGLAACALASGRGAEAVSEVAAARRLAPDDPRVLILDARVRAVRADISEEQGLRTLLERDPSDVWARIRLAELGMEQRAWPAAATLLADGLEEPPRTPELYERLGRTLAELGQHADAANAYRIALALRPDDNAVRLRLTAAEALSAGIPA